MADSDLSILARLDVAGKSAPRIHLRKLDRDTGGETAACLRRSGRYVLETQIARGREGVVYRGRDLDLGRVVALKVLRPELGNNAALVARFVEEARIGGQLQHPGIVPVYELGMQDDGRPYFAMKLVAGETLREQLAGRAEPGADRRRFLAVFEQLCQTMAYAHARGVVHRDLTPSNVMIGAFGEVHLLDWGYAKVLPLAGADREHVKEADLVGVDTATVELADAPGVTGHPAYLAPEQAAGVAAAIDERADVFSLGAILCEILTLEPPYVAANGNLFAQAEEARLDDAHARLRHCEADPELVDLARASLAPDPAQRPRDAQAVLARIASHLASVEERARRSRVAAFEARAAAERAQAEAAAQRRARRQTLATAAAVLLALLFGGGGYFWWHKTQRDRAARTTWAVREEMRAARRLVADEEWRGADDAARRAVELAESAAGNPLIRAEAEALSTDVALAQERAKQERELDEDNRALLDALEEIRLTQEDETHAARTDDAYGAVLRAHGIDIDRPLPEVVAALRARGRGAATRLAALLDDWAWLRRRASRPGWRHLADVARTVDRHTLRREIRRAWAAGDLGRLRALQASAELAQRSPRTQELFGLALVAAGDVETGVAWLREAQRLHPADARISFRLAGALQRIEPPRHADALRYLTAAVALQPRSAGLRSALAGAYLRANQPDRALAAADAALRLAPGFRPAHVQRAAALQRKGDGEGAIAALREAILAEPEAAGGYLRLGRAYRARGEIDAEIDVYREGLRAAGSTPALCRPLADALRRDGRLREAQAAYAEAGEQEWSDLCARMAAAEAKLPALLDGGFSPSGQREHALFAELCYATRHYATATRLFKRAMGSFGSVPSRALARYRYAAACAAVLAAGGAGREAVADADARARLHRQARDWLRAALPYALRKGEVRDWLIEPDLAGVREEEKLATLPELEQTAWRELWRDVRRELAAR